jgi:methionyl aminopeptidase
MCISINDEVCHGIPNPNRRLKNGDIVKIDVTTILDGFYGDTAATFTVGEVSKKARKLVRDTKKCLDIGIAQVRPENFFGNIGFEINNYAWNEGYTVVYEFAGHGVGVEFHEEPCILHVAPKDSGPVMKEGMIFTIEPMINIGVPKCKIDTWDGWTARTADGQLSAQFEHTVLVTKDGVEILTLPANVSHVGEVLINDYVTMKENP